MGLPGNFYYLKTNDDYNHGGQQKKNFNDLTGSPEEENKQIQPNINEADGHGEGQSGPNDYSDYNGDEDSEMEIGAALG